MHVTTEFIKVKRAIFDTNKEIEITNADDALKIIEETIQKMKGVAQDYQDEYKVIQDISCQFAYLLINHSTTVSSIFRCLLKSLPFVLFKMSPSHTTNSSNPILTYSWKRRPRR